MAKAGYNVEAYPPGPAGIRRSVDEVAKAMRDGRIDEAVRGWAIDQLTKRGIDGRNHPSIKARTQALLDAVRAQTIYVPDPQGAEWIQKPHVTLCLRDRCIPGEDCDGVTAALGAALLSIGLPAYAVKVTYGQDHQEHILVGIIDENGTKLYADPSTNAAVMVRVPNAVDEVWIDPLDSSSVHIGTSGAEFVTLGSPLGSPCGRQLFFKAGHWFEMYKGQWWMHVGGKWIPGPVDYPEKAGLMGPYLNRQRQLCVARDGVEIEVTPQQAGLGTIGIPRLVQWHTVHELSDLLNALTRQVQHIDAAFNGPGGQAWFQADPTAYGAWASKYVSARSAWDPTVAKATLVVHPVTPNTLSWDWVVSTAPDGTDMFDAVAKAFMPFEDLDRELRGSATFPPSELPNYSDTPQPTAPDFELTEYQIADSGWQAAKQLGQKANDVLQQAAPYLALAAAGVALYATYRIADALPRPRRA
jgi:hypothetical protein